jgi:hypothetical protein
MGFQFTKIQLEATENPNCPQLPSMKGDYFIQGYEVAVKKYKRKITNLEKENERLKGDLELWESGGCRATNLFECSVVKELKEQIEKLKADINEAIEDANRWEETETFSVLNRIYNDNFEVITNVSN